MKRILVFISVFLPGVILFSGCETTKGAATGVGTTIAATAQGAATDSKNLWQAILKADNWIKKNLW